MRMEEVWLIGSLAVDSSLLVVCAAGWWRASRRARWLETQVLPSGGEQVTTQHLQQAVEGLADQVNELANGQDFLQRILTERRATSGLPSEPPKVTTPV